MKNRIALLLAVGALPFTQLACADDEPANTVPDDVWTVVEEYSASWNDYDGAAFLETVTEDYVFVAGGFETDRDDQAANVGEGALSTAGFASEVIGDPIAVGDGPYFVAVTNRVEVGTAIDDGVSTITVVDDDGELKVAEHVWVTE